MKLKRLRNCALAAALVAGALTSVAQTVPAEPKREFRSTWVAGMGIDWPRSTNQATAKQQLITYLDNFQKQNFTGVCIHVRPRADAYYKSSYEPWSADISGRRGKDPGWDPLQFAIEECHKRGLECYAWINPYRVNANGHDYANDSRFTTDFDREWEEKGWLIKSGSWTSFNPGHPDARRHCLDVIKEIYTNYAIDGMLFDDYFYPGDGMQGANGVGTDQDAGDYELWKNSGTTLSLYDWRRHNTDTFVEELYNDIQASRPDMRFGIGPAGVAYKSASRRGLPNPTSGSDWQYDKIYADPLAWLDEGTIDFISPQIYWARSNTAAAYGVLCDWWSMVADHFGRHHYVSIASYKVETTEFTGGNGKAAGWAEIGAQVDLTRSDTRNNAPGAIYYNTVSMNGPSLTGLGNYLGENKYTKPVLVPVVTWKEHATYAPVKNLAVNGTTLSWTAATPAREKAIVRYTVYAVPSTIDIEEAKAADGDGFDSRYLLGVTYSPSYAIPSDKADNHWYAVCVYDGYGYESEASVFGFNAERADAPQLVSPAEGAQTVWDQTFTWTGVAGAQYKLQVATDAEFKNVLLTKDGLSSTSTVGSLDDFTPGSTAYWRVVSSVPGKLSGYSQARSLKTPVQAPAQKVTLVSPSDGASIEGGEIQLVWNALTDADVSRLEVQIVMAGDDFARPLVSRELKASATGTSVQTAALGKGRYNWRVVAAGHRVLSTASDSRSFVIDDVPVGSFEEGYEIKHDPATYEDVADVSLENLWYRAVGSPFQNFSHDGAANGSLNRGMVATEKHVFVSGRSEASADADIYLDQYSAITGEHLRRITLAEDGKVGSLPCNDVLKDSKGNICVANLTLDIANTPIIVHKVNLLDGTLTKVATLQANVNPKRVDHIGIFGDVDSGSFTVFAAVASSNTILRWVVVDAEKSPAATSRNITEFYPTTSSHFGVAPRVHPVSASDVYVDGGGTAWTLYSFGRSTKATGTFANATDCAPVDCSDNGGAMLSLAGKDYMLYNYSASPSGSRHAIALAGSKNFKGASRYWVLPKNSLGTVSSTTCSAPCDAVVLSPSAANIFVYSPGNGLAAYRMTDMSLSVSDISTDANSLSYVLEGLTVKLSRPAATVQVYTLTGALVKSASNVETVTLPAAGTYILRADGLCAKLMAR